MALPRGFVTFLFTDIEGSTRLFRQLGDGYVTLLERHHELLRAVWASHRGVEVKTEGDSFLVAFESSADAVEAAVEAQRSIAAEFWPHGVALRVRMGIHSGLAAPRGGDYIAYSLHQAARVVGAAHGGQVLVSESTRVTLADTTVALRSLGRYRIRDFDEPVELFQAVSPGMPDVALRPRATPAMGHNLTPPATRFVGRLDDVAGVADLLEPGALVSIVGPGGSGKTRLATQLGLGIADRWPDGVWLVELAAVSAGTPLAGIVADVLGIEVAGRDPLESIRSNMEHAEALVILDNCEHLAGAAAELAGQLLQRIPTSAVLATTREPLGIGAERIWRIAPLAAATDAVELFVDRAVSSGLRRPLSDEELAAIGRICTRLDGNPLAIELAAARVGSLGLVALEASLDDRFRILSSRRRDLAPRQQSMRALLDWSYDLLELTEQAALRRVALFADDFTLDGAEVACVDDGVLPRDALDATWALVDKSLLGVADASGETRYTMSESVREYAAALLDPAEQAGVIARLGAWYLERFGPWTDFAIGELSAARVEIDNIRGVIDGLSDLDPESAQHLAVSIGYVRDIAGEVTVGIAEIDDYVRRLDHPSPARAVLLAAAARLHHRRGSSDFGTMLDEAEHLLAEVGPEPPWAEGKVAAMRALWLSLAGRHEAATAAAESIGACDGSPVAMARRFSALGLVRGAAGDAEGAVEAHRQGLAVEEQIGSPIEIAIGHNNLAEYAMQAGATADGARHQLLALELAEQVGSVVLVAFSLIIAARVTAANGEWERAVRLHGAADRWLEQSGNALYGRDLEISEALLAEGRRVLADGYEDSKDSGRAQSLAGAIEEARRALAGAASG